MPQSLHEGGDFDQKDQLIAQQALKKLDREPKELDMTELGLVIEWLKRNMEITKDDEEREVYQKRLTKALSLVQTVMDRWGGSGIRGELPKEQ